MHKLITTFIFYFGFSFVCFSQMAIKKSNKKEFNFFIGASSDVIFGHLSKTAINSDPDLYINLSPGFGFSFCNFFDIGLSIPFHIASVESSSSLKYNKVNSIGIGYLSRIRFHEHVFLQLQSEYNTTNFINTFTDEKTTEKSNSLLLGGFYNYYFPKREQSIYLGFMFDVSKDSKSLYKSESGNSQLVFRIGLNLHFY